MSRLIPGFNLRKLYFGIICVLILSSLVLGGCNSTYSPVSPVTSPDAAAVALKPPEIITLKTNTMSLYASNFNLDIEATILNPNVDSIKLDTIKVSTQDSADYNVQKTVPGGPIDPASIRTFNFSISLPNEMLIEKQLIINVDSKTTGTGSILPVHSSIGVNIPDILGKLIVDPKVVMQAAITKLVRNGLNNQLEALVKGNIDNPNPVNLYLDTIRILIKDKQGAVLATDNLPSTLLKPDSQFSFNRVIILPVRVLNEAEITADVDVEVKLPNYARSFKDTQEIRIPQLKELISVPQLTFDTDATNARWIRTFSPPFLKMTIATLVENDNNFDLTTGDLKINIYKPQDTLINSTAMSSNIIQGIKSSSAKTITNSVDFKSDIVGTMRENAYINIRIEVGLPNVNEKIPLSASTILELRPQGWPDPVN